METVSTPAVTHRTMPIENLQMAESPILIPTRTRMMAIPNLRSLKRLLIPANAK